ncbi:MAG: tolB protein precursor [Cyanobacteria bacterium RYN_339]|nr:tolB protein precursor [Cyanobacteria bacterium RYN_339]
MKQLFPRTLLALAALVGLAAPAHAANMFDPAVGWKTIVTPHFRVNFMAGQEDVASLAAGYAEDAHKLLSPYLASEPVNRTELTLFDHEDNVNGFGFPLPNNQIYIYLSSPREDELMSHYDSWLRDILLHEYTHVLHFEKTEGIPKWINQIFGRSYFPNLFEPIFLIEGLAVTDETTYSHGGRGRDPYYGMVLRMAALEDKLASIDTASGYFTIDHPGGELPYIYGTAFYKHLIKHWGMQAPAELAKRYAHYPFFGVYGIDQVLREITGKDAMTLWADMQSELKTDAKAQVDAMKLRGPLTEPTRVTEGGMIHRHPRYMPDGSLTWPEWTGHDYAYLVSLKPGDKKPKRIISKGTGGLWTTDGRYIFHTRNWDENRFTSFDDIFRWDTKDKKLLRLTNRARVDDPSVSPDGRWVVAVQSGGGQNNLVKLRSDGKGFRKLTDVHDRSQFGGAAWHPTRNQVVVSAWRDGARDLYFVDADTGAMKPLWRDRAVDINPTWTKDGKYLVFASDRDGTFNLYAYEEKARKLFRMTNVASGLIEPALSPDGKTIAASLYGVKGWDVATIPWDPATWREVPLPASEPDITQPPPSKADYPIVTYDPWPSLRPKTWAPFAFQDEQGPILGFTTLGQDSLMKHYVFGAFGLGVPSLRPYYQVAYSNEMLYPSLYAYATDATQFAFPTDKGVQFMMAQHGQYQGLSATFPGLPSVFLQGNWITGDTLSVGLEMQNVQNITPLPPEVSAAKTPTTGQTNKVSLTYRYGDNYRFAYSISPEGGNLVTLGYEKALPLIGSFYEYDRFWADWRRYYALPWKHHVLAVRATGGATMGDKAGDYYLGGYDSSTLLSNVDLRTASSVGQRTMPLRGYTLGALTGPYAYALSAEYRFPVYSVQRGYGIYPVFIRNIHGAVFAEGGQAWKAPLDWRNNLYDVGVELRAQTHFMQAPSEVRLGVGQPLVSTGGPLYPAFFVDLGTFF